MKSPESFQRMWLIVLRQDIKFARINMRWLERQNRIAKKPIVAERGPIVSLTTYGKRTLTAHLAIESIANGTVLPSRIILWLDSIDTFKNPPRPLRRLEERGLEIKLTSDYGPHKKYYSFLESTDTFELPLVTADDDVLYPNSWLSGLASSFDEDCTVISCYRAYRMKMANGTIAPYRSWGPCTSTKPSFLNFASGSSGCLYPPAFLRALKTAGRGFERQCPKADDIWLHVNAIRAHFMVKQIGQRPLDYPMLPDTQDIGLYLSNLGLGQNDVQIRNTYTPIDIARLAATSATNEQERRPYSLSY